MEVIGGIVKNLAVIILLTTFLDMLLPSNDMQRFVKIVMGLFIIVTVLTPFITLINEEVKFEEVMAFSNPSNNSSLEKIMADGTNLANANQSIVVSTYKGKLEKQMEVLVELLDSVGEVEVEIEIATNAEQIIKNSDIKMVVVNVVSTEQSNDTEIIKPIEPIKVEIKSESMSNISEEVKNFSPTDSSIEREIKDLLASYFDIREENIKVTFVEIMKD